MIIFKTTSEHLDAVRRNLKYATDDIPTELKVGDSVLIQVTYLSEKQGPPKIRYAWKHYNSYEDKEGESFRLWGYQWRYIIEGQRLCRLKHPFDIRDVQVTEKDYGSAQRYVYVAPEDERIIVREGLLVCW